MSVKIALSSDISFWIFWPILTDLHQLACVAGRILVPAVLSWQSQDGKSCLLHFLPYEFWMTPTFVCLVKTIWLPNHEEWCNTKLTCKWARPSVKNSLLLATIKSFMLEKRSKNFLNCYRGQILSETTTTENQCWNACRKHIGLMTSQSAKITFAQSEWRILHTIFHPFF